MCMLLCVCFVLPSLTNKRTHISGLSIGNIDNDLDDLDQLFFLVYFDYSSCKISDTFRTNRP